MCLKYEVIANEKPFRNGRVVFHFGVAMQWIASIYI